MTGFSAPTPAYEIRVARLGTLPVPPWETYLGRSGTELVPLSFYLWSIVGDDLVAIVDTGLPQGPDLDALNAGCRFIDPESYFHDVRPTGEALAELGLAPEDIDVALVTQTVTYSTGGLGPELLPRATVYLAKAGIDELLTDPPGHPDPRLYFTRSGWDFLGQLAMERRLVAASGRVDVAPGLRFEPTGGHHPGSAAVRVATADGVIGILETAFLQDNVDDGHPIGIAEDAARCRVAIRRYVAECAEVLAIHDPAHAARFGTRAADGRA